MKNINLYLIVIMIAFMPLLQGCEIAGDIFQGGIWIGVSLTLIIIIGVLWLFNRLRK